MLDTVIIGAGPAGLTAFYYSLMYGLLVQCVGVHIGGKLLLAPFVVDYPGNESITGKEFINHLLNQIKTFKQEPIVDEVVTLASSPEAYKATTKLGKVSDAKTLILATGNGNKQRENQTVKLAGQLGLATEKGFIKIHQELLTSSPNVFAAGECMAYPYSLEQLVTSVSTGAKAAANVYEYIKKEKPPIVWGESKIKRF